MPQPAEMVMTGMMRDRVADGESAFRQAAADKGQEYYRRELNSNNLSHEGFRVESVSEHSFHASSGYSKGCCQAAQKKTDFEPLRPYSNRLVTALAEAKPQALYRQVEGRLRSIEEIARCAKLAATWRE